MNQISGSFITQKNENNLKEIIKADKVIKFLTPEFYVQMPTNSEWSAQSKRQNKKE